MGSTILLLTNALRPSAEILPALGLLLHDVRVAPAEAAALLDAPVCDAVLVDARRDLGHARGLTRRVLAGVGHCVRGLRSQAGRAGGERSVRRGSRW